MKYKYEDTLDIHNIVIADRMTLPTCKELRIAKIHAKMCTGKKKLCSDHFTSENHTYTDNILVRSSDDKIQEKFT